jgi:hypothetical protein
VELLEPPLVLMGVLLLEIGSDCLISSNFFAIDVAANRMLEIPP